MCSRNENTEEQEDAPAGELAKQRPVRGREKSIRLDDLFPKQTVVGGRQLLFGASDPTQVTKNLNRKRVSHAKSKEKEKRQSSRYEAEERCQSWVEQA